MESLKVETVIIGSITGWQWEKKALINCYFFLIDIIHRISADMKVETDIIATIMSSENACRDIKHFLSASHNIWRHADQYCSAKESVYRYCKYSLVRSKGHI